MEADLKGPPLRGPSFVAVDLQVRPPHTRG